MLQSLKSHFYGKSIYGGVNMRNKEKELNRELGIHEQHDQVSNMIDTMLALGPVNLGLNNPKIERYAEQRIKEDITK
ncbi:hypothetical protein D3C75_1184380 [compost metagenome]